MGIPPSALVEVALRHLEEFSQCLEAPLVEVWSAMLGERLGADPHRYFLAPLAQPLLLLPFWAAELVGEVPEQVLDDSVGAGVVGYHGVRLLDDLVDEGRGEPVSTVLLATAALSRAQSLLARHVSGRPFWDEYSRAMSAYVQGMAAEREIRGHPEDYDDDAFARVLQQARPLAVPGLAILAWGGRWDAAPSFAELLGHLSRGIQIAGDLIDARGDREHRSWTWVLARLEGGSAETVDALVDAAQLEFAEAGRQAERLGVTGCLPWVEEASERLERLRQEFWERTFRAAAGQVE